MPDWLKPLPDEDSTNFVTFLSSDGSRAVRILAPVEVYPPGSNVAVAPPNDFLGYVLGQADSGVQFTDRTDTTIDSHPATVVTATTDVPLDGSVGCPESGIPADTCYGSSRIWWYGSP